MSDVIPSSFVQPVVPDNHVKFGDHRLNRSEEIPLKPSEAAFSTVFCCGFRPEVVSDVISCADVG